MSEETMTEEVQEDVEMADLSAALDEAAQEFDLPDNYTDDDDIYDSTPNEDPEMAEKEGDQPTTEEAEVVPEPVAEPTEEPDSSEGIRALRERHKEQARENKALQQKLAELEEKVNAPAPKPKSEEDRIAEQYSTEDLLTYLGKYEANELDLSEAEADRLKGVALQALERKNSTEILEVMRKARAGQMGTVSREIQGVAAEALATASALSEGRKQQEVANQDWQNGRNASFAQVLQVEGLSTENGQFNAESDQGKAYLADAELVAQAIPSLKDLPNAPELVLEYHQSKQKASAYDRDMPTLQKENEELKARLARFGDSLPSGTAPSGNGSTKRTAEQELADAFKAHGMAS